VILQQMSRHPDAIYGHFLYPAGAIAVSLGKEMGIPAFPAVGENSLNTIYSVEREKACRELTQATAFIANSNYLAQLISRNLGIVADRIGVFPNGVNRNIFFPRERSSMRQKYGFPLDRLIVAFVGNFEHGKGARRVAEAIHGIDRVAGVFVGSGDEPPKGEEVIFCQRVPHEQVPELLSACDVFVLPTTDEGCCNAILEAMACGLPVVSSMGSFNDDVLNESVSIRIDPLEVPAIRAAIVRLRDDLDLRVEMGHAALAWSQNFNIDLRARRILEFMSQRLNQNEIPERFHGAKDARETIH
jgi:glycosyltransferase involved in cell wall biosynthesis